MISVIDQNIKLNDCDPRQVQCKELFWGSQEHLDKCLRIDDESVEQFDLILGSDILYDFDYFKELVETLDLLYIRGKSEIIFCYTHRFSDVERWFREELDAKGFSYALEPEEELHPDFRDDGKILLLRIFK